MTMMQRSVWAQILVFPLVGVIYFAVVATRAASTPVENVSWVVPMIWALGVLVAGIVALTVLGAIGHGVNATAHGEQPEFSEGDTRDQEIEQYGDYRARHFMAVGSLAVIVLAMLGADHFWIANAIFLAAILGATYAAVVKLRAYRQGF